MKQIPLSDVKDDLSKYLRQAAKEEIVITRHGKPAGVLVGFASEDEWFDYRLEHDPRFLARIAKSRQSLRQGKGIKLEAIISHNTRLADLGGSERQIKRPARRRSHKIA